MEKIKAPLLSRLSNLMMIRVTKYISVGLIVLILIQFYSTFHLQQQNRRNAIGYALENIAPVIELTLWNYNYQEAQVLAESLHNNALIHSVLIRDDFQNTIAGIGNTKELEQMNFDSKLLSETSLDSGSVVFAMPIWFQDGEAEPTLIGELVVASKNSLIWNDIAETLAILVTSLIGFVLIFLAVLYFVQQSIVSRRLELLSSSIAQLTNNDRKITDYAVDELTQFDDELTDVYLQYRQVKSELSLREKELQQYHQDLEHEVDTRTGELKLANKFLKDSLEQLKIAQAELVERERLASLGSLVSGIAHEVNTPLGVSITANSYLQEEVKVINDLMAQDNLTKSSLNAFLANCEESCDIMSSNMERAASLIKSFKQVAVDQSSEESRKLNLEEYISDIVRSLQPQLKRSKVSIIQEITQDYILTTFPGALAQVVTNLIMNAYIHGYDNGLMAGVIRVGILDSEKDDECVISIKDNGIGMPNDVREKIYDPFFTTKRGTGGSGLGLNIVYNLVIQKLGGRLECISNLNEGTEFILHIPATKADM